MSIKVTSWVWDNYTGKNTKLLMMLAIADFCDDEGVCYPGVKRLAEKTRVAKGTAQKLIRDLREDKELSIVLNDGLETEHGKTNRYYVIKYRHSAGLTTPASTETSHGRKTDEPPYRGVKSDTSSNDTVGGIKSDEGGINSSTPEVSPEIPKPSVEPSVKNSKKQTASNSQSSKYEKQTGWYALADVWIKYKKNDGMVKPQDLPNWQKTRFKAWHDMEVNPEQLQGYIDHLCSGTFYADKPIGWSFLSDNLNKWIDLQKKNPQPTPANGHRDAAPVSDAEARRYAILTGEVDE